MSYQKTNWENLPSTSTPISAANLNKIEDELAQLDSDITVCELELADTDANVSTLQTKVDTLERNMYSVQNAVTSRVKYSDFTQTSSGWIEIKKVNTSDTPYRAVSESLLYGIIHNIKEFKIDTNGRLVIVTQ